MSTTKTKQAKKTTETTKQPVSFQIPPWSIALYAVSLAVYYKAMRLLFSVPIEINGHRGTHFQFLTVLGLLSSVATQSLGFLESLSSIFGFKSTSQSLNKAKTLTSYVSAPLEFVVVIMFWALFLKDPGMVVSVERAGLMPAWLNYSVHLYPAFFEALNLLFCSANWTIGFVGHSLLFVVFALGYLGWVHYAKNQYGMYPYPFLDVLTPIQWTVLWTGGTGIAVISGAFLKKAQTILRG